MSSVEFTILSIAGVEGVWEPYGRKMGAFHLDLSADELERLSLAPGSVVVVRSRYEGHTTGIRPGVPGPKSFAGEQEQSFTVERITELDEDAFEVQFVLRPHQ